MPGNPRQMIAEAERVFPVRIRIGIPPNGLGQRYSQITDWLDANCGADDWALTPAGTRGVLNDAISVYFADATLAGAFVDRWCVGPRSRRPAAYSGCARMSRHLGSGWGCIGRREGEPHPRRNLGTKSRVWLTKP
jgi:hypothetical protein